jgi:hypothetical protein
MGFHLRVFSGNLKNGAADPDAFADLVQSYGAGLREAHPAKPDGPLGWTRPRGVDCGPGRRGLPRMIRAQMLLPRL